MGHVDAHNQPFCPLFVALYSPQRLHQLVAFKSLMVWVLHLRSVCPRCFMRHPETPLCMQHRLERWQVVLEQYQRGWESGNFLRWVQIMSLHCNTWLILIYPCIRQEPISWTWLPSWAGFSGLVARSRPGRRIHEGVLCLVSGQTNAHMVSQSLWPSYKPDSRCMLHVL